MIKDSEHHDAGMEELGDNMCVNSTKPRTQLNMFQAEQLPVANDSLTGKGKFTTPTPDYDMANRFFDALTGSVDEGITFQFFTDNKELKAAIPKDGRDTRACYVHKKRPIDFDFADKKQAKGCGVYTMVNAGDGKGRKATNVVSVRAFFIDLDGSPWEPAAQVLKPHMRVESSSGRWHLYWLVEDCELDDFKPIQQAIALKYNGDETCCDLPRVLRVPGFFHLKKDPVMTVLVEDNDFPRYTTQQVVEGLGLDLNISEKAIKNPKDCVKGEMDKNRPSYSYTDKITGEITDLRDWAAKNPTFDIVAALVKKYANGGPVNGKQHIICPFADEHTDTSTDFATFIVNATPPDHTSFNIHCMHSHCAGRDRLDFLQAMFSEGWLLKETLVQRTLPPKRVPKIYYPATEMASMLQGRTLTADEFRVLLHLMHIFFSIGENGTLPDDDWLVARSVGLDEPQWLKYKETLIRSGWLTIVNDALICDIFAREFSAAQNAYDNSRIKGQKGGISSRSAS